MASQLGSETESDIEIMVDGFTEQFCQQLLDHLPNITCTEAMYNYQILKGYILQRYPNLKK